MTPEDRYHFEPLLMSVQSAIARGESVGQYHHSEVLRLLLAALAAAEATPLDVCPDCGLTAERIGQMHITAQRLRSPDTETAGEAG